MKVSSSHYNLSPRRTLNRRQGGPQVRFGCGGSVIEHRAIRRNRNDMKVMEKEEKKRGEEQRKEER
jgi:hypothetical protein